MPTRSAATAPIQRVVHRTEDLIHRDLAIIVGVAAVALRYFGVAEGDIHHGEDVVRSDVAIAVAVADAARWWRWCRGRRRGAWFSAEARRWRRRSCGIMHGSVVSHDCPCAGSVKQDTASAVIAVSRSTMRLLSSSVYAVYRVAQPGQGGSGPGGSPREPHPGEEVCSFRAKESHGLSRPRRDLNPRPADRRGPDERSRGGLRAHALAQPV
jgi:hypothetical protein